MTTSSMREPQWTRGPTFLDAALQYHRAHAWSIIPVREKRAIGLWKPFQTVPTDEATLRKLFARPEVTGLAVVLGPVSGGLACRDWDEADAYRRWAQAHPGLAATLPTVQTARGFHVYFIGPSQFQKLGDGEYRGDSRHYCVLPPSAHPDGPVYQWVIPLPATAIPVVDPVQVGLLAHAFSQAQTQAITQADPADPADPAHTLHVSATGVKAAILVSQPTAIGQRNGCLWVLARRLKAIIPEATVADLEIAVRDWHSQALPVIGTKDWLETWVDFRIAWANVKRPFGVTMADILATARSETPPDADEIARLIALCRALQEHHGPNSAWSLSCRLAGELVGVGHTTAARILKMLCAEGTLEMVTAGGGKGSKRAAEYRFLGD